MAGTVTVRILGDATGFQKALGSVEGGVGKIGGAFKGLAAVAGGALAGIGITTFALDTVGVASDVNESLSKVKTVFGDSSAAIESFADKAATNLGISRGAALDMAGTFGNMFTQLGIGTDEAAAMSQQMGTLAADLGSFHNADPTAVIESMTSAFRGEYDAVQKFVPTINAATVEQKALAMTGKSVAKELTAGEKALATQTLLMEGAGAAAGDFARTSDSLANKQRVMAAKFEDAKAKLGSALMPVMAAAAGFLTDKLIPAFETLVSGVQKVIDVFREQGLAGVIDLVKTKFAELWPTVSEKLGEFASAFGSWIAEMAPVVAEKLVEWGKAFIEWIGPQIPPFLVELGKFLGAALEWVLTEGVPLLVEHLLKMAAALVEWIGPAIPPMLVELGKLLVQLGEWLLTDALPTLIGKLLEWAGAFVAWVAPLIPPLLLELGALLARIGVWIVTDALPGLVGKLGEWAAAFVGWVADAITNMPGKLGELAGTLLGWIGEMPGKIATAAVGMFDGISTAFKEAINWIIRKWNDFKIEWGGFDPPGPGSIPGFTIDTPNIPLLAKGGIVTRPTLAVIGEAGPEAVVPLNGRKFGATATIPLSSVRPGDLIDGADLVAKLIEFQRRNGPIRIQVA